MAKKSNEEIIALCRQNIAFLGGKLDCMEIGDGNVNYVYRVADENGKSVIVKYADSFIRNSGTRKLSVARSEIESRILAKQAELAPGFVPEVYKYDKENSCIFMEDLHDYSMMRTAMLTGGVFPFFAEQMGNFLYSTLVRTTDLVMQPADKKKLAGELINPDMCEISERLVFTEPYKNRQGLNSCHPSNQRYVEEKLYNNAELITEAAKLKDKFKNHSQSMIHGDLHAGSIFINDSQIKVFDPEFAFYGPMGYDIGNIIGNIIISRICAVNAAESFKSWLSEAIPGIWDTFFMKYQENFTQDVTDPMGAEPAFQAAYLREILADTCGYAGTEIIRRTIGVAKVKEIELINDDAIKPGIERALIETGAELIMNRHKINSGADIAALVGKYA